MIRKFSGRFLSRRGIFRRLEGTFLRSRGTSPRSRGLFLRSRGVFLRSRGMFLRSRGMFLRFSGMFLRFGGAFLRSRGMFLGTGGPFLQLGGVMCGTGAPRSDAGAPVFGLHDPLPQTGGVVFGSREAVLGCGQREIERRAVHIALGKGLRRPARRRRSQEKPQTLSRQEVIPASEDHGRARSSPSRPRAPKRNAGTPVVATSLMPFALFLVSHGTRASACLKYWPTRTAKKCARSIVSIRYCLRRSGLEAGRRCQRPAPHSPFEALEQL